MFYRIEDIIEDKEDLTRLGQECWDEVDQAGKSGMLFDPDWDNYNLLNQSGMVRYYTVYDHTNTNKVGFGVFIISKSLHMKDKFIATSDCIYLQPEYRGYGTEFIRLIINDLKSEGVHLFSLHIKQWEDSGSLADKVGCVHYENVLQRRLN